MNSFRALERLMRNFECVQALAVIPMCAECVQEYENLLRWSQDELTYSRYQEAVFNAKKAKRVDYYKVLGVPSVASQPEIKTAYRAKATEWHPDKKSHLDEEGRKNAEEVFKQINEAYEMLSNPETKALFDEGHDKEGIQEELEKRKMR